MITKWIQVFMLVAVQTITYSYPISPRPLRLLIEESKLIVWAHVRQIKEVSEEGQHGFGSTLAVLTIHEVLQGRLNVIEIEVPYSANMICPAPPHFTERTDVLVFLNHKKGKYFVHALSYGVKELKPEEMIVYKARIREMQQIMRIVDRDEKFLSTTEWLVKCAEEPTTRHEGTYELSRESDFMSYYDRNEGQPFRYALNDEQRLRLKNALLNSRALLYADLGLIDLVYNLDAERVCKHILAKLKEWDENHLWFANEFMHRVNLYKSSPRTIELAKVFEEKCFDLDLKSSKLKNILDEFVVEASKLIE